MLNRLENYFIFFDKENNAEIEKVLYKHYKHVLKIFAIFPSLNRKYFKLSLIQFTFIVLVLLFHSIILGVTTLVVYQNITLFNLSFHYTLLMSLCVFMMLVTITKRNQIYRIYEIINTGFFNYNEPDDKYILDTKSEIEKEKYYLSFLPLYIAIMSGVVVIIGPVVDKFAGSNYDDIKSIESVNLLLPVKAWYPFNTNEGILYYLAFIGQLTTAAFVSGVVGSMDLIYINCMQELILQLLILNHSIEKLEKRALNMFKQDCSNWEDIKDYRNNAIYHRCYYKCLKQNIIHHQVIKKYFDAFQAYISLILFPVFSVATIVIALSMNEMSQESNNIGSGLMSSMLVFGEILNILLICIYGEKVTTLSTDLRVTIYNVKWYNSLRNPYIKNIIPMMQEFTKRTLKVSDTFAKANLETFSTVMNSAYSYFNLLSASKSS